MAGPLVAPAGGRQARPPSRPAELPDVPSTGGKHCALHSPHRDDFPDPSVMSPSVLPGR